MTAELPPTEAANARSAGLDLLPTPQLVELLIAEQRDAVEAVLACAHTIARAVEEIAARLRDGGVLHYVGAGSSGRIAMLDAAEMPPTFGTAPELVRAHVAGGDAALTRAIEGAEDDAEAGDAAMRAAVRAGDAVVGISASGSAAFVVAAVARARVAGAFTVAVTAHASSPLARAAELVVAPATGAEAVAGSTRLKGGTAQKVALNAISTAVMVRLGRVYDNLMVGVVAGNRKLRARAVRLVQAIAGVDETQACRLLDEAGGNVKVAVVMARRGIGRDDAEALLARHDGVLRGALE